MSDKIRIRPELSAQGVRKKPNPMLGPSWSALKEFRFVDRADPLLVDYGCGQLRNLATLLSFSPRVVLVDTEAQLATQHEFYGTKMLISEFIRERWSQAKIRLMTSSQFEASRIRADVVFIVNVLDVIPRRVRERVVRIALRHIKPSGALVIIAPRNDTWTLRICTRQRAFEDGFAFRHARGYTFYKNWRANDLQSWLRRKRIDVIRDLSCYRQVCLVCAKMRVGLR